jgi:acetyl esterase/lipase
LSFANFPGLSCLLLSVRSPTLAGNPPLLPTMLRISISYHSLNIASKSWVVFLLIPSWVLVAQPALQSIPRDTSFTISAETKSVQAQYPFAKVVVPHLPDGVAVDENIVYAAYGKRLMHLDLFTPEESDNGSLPGVLLVHGGGWRSGDRSLQIPLAQFLAAHGYVTAVVEYRLSTEAPYPMAVHDIKSAVRWMRAHASEYNIDSARIAVSGSSAGGHIAALVGTTNGNAHFEGNGSNAGHSSLVQAVIDMDGILDFTDPAESGKDTLPGELSAGAQWFGATYKEKPQLWIEASPVVHVDANTPPIVFINSSRERFHAGRDLMIEQLKTLGIYYEVHTIPNTPHAFWLFHPWFESASNSALKFLDVVFRNQSRNVR